MGAGGGVERGRGAVSQFHYSICSEDTASPAAVWHHSIPLSHQPSPAPAQPPPSIDQLICDLDMDMEPELQLKQYFHTGDS